MTAVDVLIAGGVRLREAMTGVLLPPRSNGAQVAVSTGPPNSAAGLPAAWCELIRGGAAPDRMVSATVRYLIVPPQQENQAMSDSVCAALDALEATKLPGAWTWQLVSVEIGGADVLALAIDVPATYPATC